MASLVDPLHLIQRARAGTYQRTPPKRIDSFGLEDQSRVATAEQVRSAQGQCLAHCDGRDDLRILLDALGIRATPRVAARTLNAEAQTRAATGTPDGRIDPPTSRLRLPGPLVRCEACGQEREHAGHGWCEACYLRWLRAGKPTAGPPPPRRATSGRRVHPRVAPPSKRCSRCGEAKPIKGFAADQRTPDGRRSECKTCFNARRRKGVQV